jgi:hypothetical protein
MPITYEPIATNTVSSPVASVAFTSIPSTYTDLRVVTLTRSTRVTTDDYFQMQFNNDSGANYTTVDLSGNAGSASSGNTNSTSSFGDILRCVGANAASGLFTFHTFDIFSYASTSLYKSGIITQQQDTGGAAGFSGPQVSAKIAVWKNSSAINRIDIGFGNLNLATGTTFTLYGIKAA